MLSALVCLTIAAASPQVGEVADFLGFSPNERLAVWTVRVAAQRQGTAIDSYTLGVVVNVDDRQVVAEYRASNIYRRTRRGRPIKGGKDNLLRDNPRYRDALSRKQWQQLRRKVRLAKGPLEMHDSVLRLLPDPDIELQADADKKRIEVWAAPGHDVGFRPVVRLYDGQKITLGQARKSAAPGDSIRANVRAYFSRSGRSVAVLSQFVVTDSDGQQRHAVSTQSVRFDSPIGTVYIGNLKSGIVQQELMGDIFKSVHPEASRKYEHFVERGW